MSKASNEANNKPIQALLNAVATSKLRLVRLLIEGGVDVNVRDNHGQTPLLITCSLLNNTCHSRGETRERVVKYLISAGADVNAYDVTGRTSLIYAVITRASVVPDLMDAGADPWWEDGNRKCAFDYVLQEKDIGLVQIMVDAYKRRKMRGIPPVIRDTRGIVRDVIDARESHKHIEDTTHGKQEKKSTKNKETKPNRKRLAQSRNISSPGLTTFNKNTTDKSSDSPPTTLQHTCGPHESTSNIPASPGQSTNIHQLPEIIQLCGLCKSIFSAHAQNQDEDKISQPYLAETVNFEEYDFSGFLYRRRSSESLFGLTEKRYESIRRKSELGITLEDLFSSTEINQPGKHPLYVKSPRTNTMIDISANELLVPDRGRSLSVCLPPLDNVRLRVGDGYPLVTSAKSAPQLHIMAWSHAGSMIFNPESRVYPGSDDEFDDVIIFPATHRSLTSSPTRSVTSSPEDNGESHHDMTSLYGEFTSQDESEACNSPIPTIVLTDSM